VASSRLSKNGSLLKCSGTGLAESTLCSLCSRATRGRRRCVPAAAPYVRAAPQENCSADTGAVGPALNPLPRKRFPAGDQIRLDGATTTRPAACGDPASQPADTAGVWSHRGSAEDMNCGAYRLTGDRSSCAAVGGSLIPAAYTYGSSGPIMVSASIFRAIS
jgi:hypothetical protein